MKIFVTGASGFIGSAVTKELINLGHQLFGLARSEKSAAVIRNTGATPLHGSLEDLDSLAKGVSESDGVINLGFNHDSSQFDLSVQVELKAIETMGELLKGTGRPFLIASGGPTITEKFDLNDYSMPRIASAVKVLELAKQNVRSSAIRLAPCVNDGTRRGFVGVLVDIAKRTGVSGYAGDGSNRWSAVHLLDAADLICRAFEKAPAGSVLQAVADEGIPLKVIAERIGDHLKVPVGPIADGEIRRHFGWLGRIIRADLAASSRNTKKLLDWQPMHPGLLHDLDHGHFFDEAS